MSETNIVPAGHNSSVAACFSGSKDFWRIRAVIWRANRKATTQSFCCRPSPSLFRFGKTSFPQRTTLTIIPYYVFAVISTARPIAQALRLSDQRCLIVLHKILFEFITFDLLKRFMLKSHPPFLFMFICRLIALACTCKCKASSYLSVCSLSPATSSNRDTAQHYINFTMTFLSCCLMCCSQCCKWVFCISLHDWLILFFFIFNLLSGNKPHILVTYGTQ